MDSSMSAILSEKSTISAMCCSCRSKLRRRSSTSEQSAFRSMRWSSSSRLASIASLSAFCCSVRSMDSRRLDSSFGVSHGFPGISATCCSRRSMRSFMLSMSAFFCSCCWMVPMLDSAFFQICCLAAANLSSMSCTSTFICRPFRKVPSSLSTWDAPAFCRRTRSRSSRRSPTSPWSQTLSTFSARLLIFTSTSSKDTFWSRSVSIFCSTASSRLSTLVSSTSN
mmetsp:Transcript_26319/g.71515  ORF Transcript_26319/g.71515 Transcript_26319/m.71515 type:complete len:224 (-) Transcript_26319:214-885(-)